jgi:hypothetical protein
MNVLDLPLTNSSILGATFKKVPYSSSTHHSIEATNKFVLTIFNHAKKVYNK